MPRRDEVAVEVVQGKEDGVAKINRPLVQRMLQKLPSAPLGCDWPDRSSPICRVRPSIREVNEGVYTPKFVSIGPFHHGTSLYGEDTEWIKWWYLQDLLNRSPDNNKLEKYVDEVYRLEEKARRQYSGGVPNIDRDAFVEMLVVDGCFVVEFVLKHFLREDESYLDIVLNNLVLVRTDLLLLENQIPLFVLCRLFELSHVPQLNSILGPGFEWPTADTFLMLSLHFVTSGRMEELMGNAQVIFAHHLLDLLHMSFFPDPAYEKQPVAWYFVAVNLMLRLAVWVLNLPFRTVKYIAVSFTKQYIGKRKRRRLPVEIPSATSLQETGFRFKKKEVDFSFVDVTRNSKSIEIPAFSTDEAKLVNIQNLVAYEQCGPTGGKHGPTGGKHVYSKIFSSYARFMGSLVATPEDVVLLRERGIIEGMVGRDGEVVSFFADLCKGVRLDRSKNHNLSELFRYLEYYYVERSYAVKMYKWRKKLIPDYFTNPWAVPSMAAAFVLLVLTVVSTFYTVYPYYRPSD